LIKFKKLILLVLIFFGQSFLFGEANNISFYEKIDNNGVELKKVLNSEKIRVKIFLNQADTSQKEIKLFGDTSSFSLDFSIPNRWEILEAKVYANYTPSIALEPTRSFISLSLNKKVIRQFKLLNSKFIDQGIIKIKDVEVSRNLIEEHNKFTIQVFQHYLKTGSENMSLAPEVWTQIDLQNSYIEFTIKEKKIPEKVSSVFELLFDKKNPLETEINFVIPKNNISDNLIFNYAFISSIIGNTLQYRKVDFSISDKIDPTKDNILIGLESEVKSIISDFNENLISKIKGNINIISEFGNSTKAIIALTAQTPEELKKVIFSTISFQQNIYDGPFLNIHKVNLPEKSQPYSAPNFLSIDKKYFFKDLNYKTKTFTGFYSEPLNLDFYLYPDLFFGKKAKVDFNLDVFYPKVVKDDSVLNVFVNNVYATQFEVKSEQESKDLLDYFSISGGATGSFETQLLQEGKNRLNFSFKMVPLIDPKYTTFNTENLKASISENSYFEIPDANHWVELPNLKYFSSTAYPFSIYPDLQDMAILIEQPTKSNLKALMQMMFYFGEVLQYPAYYFEVSQKLKESMRSKHLLIIGKTENQNINKNSQIKIESDFVEKIQFFDKKLSHDFENLNASDDSDKNELNSTRNKIVVQESGKYIPYGVIQMFQSPFNDEKTVVSIFDKSPNNQSNLGDLTKFLLQEKFINKFKGGMAIFKVDDKSSSKNTKIYFASFEPNRSYFVGDLNIWDKSRFYVSNNPVLFTFVAFLSLILLTYFVRKSLLLYKARYHDDAD
jgi:hypothetical protein